MKKTCFFLLIFIFNLLIIKAQPSEIVAGLSSPHGILLQDNILYITQYTSGKVSKIDLTARP